MEWPCAGLTPYKMDASVDFRLICKEWRELSDAVVILVSSVSGVPDYKAGLVGSEDERVLGLLWWLNVGEFLCFYSATLQKRRDRVMDWEPTGCNSCSVFCPGVPWVRLGEKQQEIHYWQKSSSAGFCHISHVCVYLGDVVQLQVQGTHRHFSSSGRGVNMLKNKHLQSNHEPIEWALRQ